jgi:hypothetical protein
MIKAAGQERVAVAQEQVAVTQERVAAANAATQERMKNKELFVYFSIAFVASFAFIEACTQIKEAFTLATPGSDREKASLRQIEGGANAASRVGTMGVYQALVGVVAYSIVSPFYLIAAMLPDFSSKGGEVEEKKEEEKKEKEKEEKAK